MRSLELQARLIVEGYLSGMHKSPYHGFSVEFAQHREYVPGDDLKHLDWKVYGRTGRFYLKQYEEETNLTLWLLVDASESMRYGSGAKGDDGEPLVRKYDYAAWRPLALSYLTLHQQDARRPGHLRRRRPPVPAAVEPAVAPQADRQYPQPGAGAGADPSGPDLPRPRRTHRAAAPSSSCCPTASTNWTTSSPG